MGQSNNRPTAIHKVVETVIHAQNNEKELVVIVQGMPTLNNHINKNVWDK